MSNIKKIAFLTGTRADFGKIKSLLQILQKNKDFEPSIFVTGMHMMKEYGYTLIEVERTGFKNISTFKNHTDESTMDLTLAKTIEGFSKYVKQLKPTLIVVHGDRVEALAGAIVGSLNNILVAHIEGGELSGTIDELIRHSVSKLSHIHFVSNDDAKRRLIQMGELKQSIHTIGSPDIDSMFSNTLPTIEEVKKHYQIPFKEYATVLFHPVTTEVLYMKKYTTDFVDALIQSNKNYVVIYPNNDLGSKHIIETYERLKGNKKFKIYPSIRFEYFLTLLKKATFIIGNSSAGIREAPYYGIPTINVGSRQNNRASDVHILNTDYSTQEILKAINSNLEKRIIVKENYGKGDSAKQFLESLNSNELWELNHQKQFKEYGND